MTVKQNRLMRSTTVLFFISMLIFTVSRTSATEEGCGYPGLPANARFVKEKPELNSEYPVGYVITYECEESFRLVGDAQRTCECTGRWNGSIPECVGESTELRIPSPDYYVIDPESSPLEPEEIWEETIKFPVLCGIPDIPNDGKLVVIKGKDGTVHVTYECKSGYYLDGENLRTCEEDGSWSGNPPRCTLAEIDQSHDEKLDDELTRSKSQSLTPNPTGTSNLDAINGIQFENSSPLLEMDKKILAKIELELAGEMGTFKDLMIVIAVLLTFFLALIVVGLIKYINYLKRKEEKISQSTRPCDEETPQEQTAIQIQMGNDINTATLRMEEASLLQETN